MKNFFSVTGVIVIVLTTTIIFFFIKDCSDSSGKKIKALRNEIKYRNSLIEGVENNLETIKLERDVIRKEKEKAQRSFKKLKKQFENYKDIKPAEIIKTVVVEKIEYVPKIEYKKLYDFTNEIKEKFSLYLRIDKNSDWNISKVINDFNNLLKYKDEIIDRQNKIISLKKKPRRWGLYFGYGLLNNKFDISVGYRIF